MSDLLGQLNRDVGRVLTGRPMVFFLGAGASVGYPSCLPDPRAVSSAIRHEITPASHVPSPADVDALKRGVAEVFHEVLDYAGADGTREMWQCLNAWKTVEFADLDLGPNAVHLLVCYLAWRSRTPVITVNFDEMMEAAADVLGLEAASEVGAETTSRQVAVWHLHGRVSRPTSIRTTLRSITAYAPDALAQTRAVFEQYPACLIGYSGRDVDFFPFLCGWDLPDRPFWMNLEFEMKQSQAVSDRFRKIKGIRAEEWASQIIGSRLRVRDSTGRRLQAANPPLGDRSEADERFRNWLRVAAQRVYGPAFTRNERRRLLVQAMAMAANGRFRSADQAAEQLIGIDNARDAIRCRAELLRSSMGHEESQYLNSARHAEQAIVIAKKLELDAMRAEGHLRLVEAHRMAYLQRLPGVRLKRDTHARGWRAIMTSVRFAIQFRAWRSLPQNPDFDRLRTTFEYLEHLIRLAATAQGFCERALGSQATTKLMKPVWSRLGAWSWEAGYAFGIGNTKKYMHRFDLVEVREAEMLPATRLFDLSAAATGEAIELRDQAAATLSQALKEKGASRDAGREQAQNLFGAALDKAKDTGNASLELKIRIAMIQADLAQPLSEAKAEELLARIQAPVLGRSHKRLLRALSSKRW